MVKRGAWEATKRQGGPLVMGVGEVSESAEGQASTLTTTMNPLSTGNRSYFPRHHSFEGRTIARLGFQSVWMLTVVHPYLLP
ncbi:hypothetical protein GQ457_18G019810 [Hibiscus cannabinus]